MYASGPNFSFYQPERKRKWMTCACELAMNSNYNPMWTFKLILLDTLMKVFFKEHNFVSTYLPPRSNVDENTHLLLRWPIRPVILVLCPTARIAVRVLYNIYVLSPLLTISLFLFAPSFFKTNIPFSTPFYALRI
jgi:hypothetical protein